MKLSFSTLACPDWTFNELFSAAADLGYNGIEIRGVADEIYAPKIPVFSAANLEATKARLAKANLQIPILTSGAYLCGNDNMEAAELEVKDYVMLAGEMGVKYVRVLAEKDPEPNGTFDFYNTVSRYQALCDFAAPLGVSVLTETNGALSDTALLRSLMEKVDRENAGVIWDIHHPYRYFGEEPQTTMDNIGKYVKHVHIKDSVKGTNGAITYMLCGYGDNPIKECVSLLKNAGYDGFISYEWVKRWSRELAEPGISLFQYVSYMRGLRL